MLFEDNKYEPTGLYFLNCMYPIYPHYVQPSQSLQTQEQFQFTIKKTTIFHHTNNNYDNQVSLP